MSVSPALHLSGFGVAFADRVVLADVSFDLPATGLTTLLGPAGSGKSTLLRTIAGLNDAHPALSRWGTALVRGAPLRAATTPGEPRLGMGVVVQHARFYMDTVRETLANSLPDRASHNRLAQTQIVRDLLVSHGLAEVLPALDDDVASLPTPIQRRLAIVRALVGDPPLLFADEPTTGLEDNDAVEILALLRSQASQRSVLLVTHNQRHARVAGGSIVLLAGGRVRETGPSSAFFAEPRSEAGRSFLRTGSCADASPDARVEDLDSRRPPPPPLPEVAVARSRFAGPRGFFWVKPGQLGGLPRPGIVDSVEHDCAGLERLGVSTLVTLEEAETVDREALSAARIAPIHFPIVDMRAPSVAAAAQLVARVDELVRGGGVVALHCRAGLGRTGTMLASQLVFDGERAAQAIERIRRVDPRCIQSQEQVEFLSAFEIYMRGRRGTTAAELSLKNARS